MLLRLERMPQPIALPTAATATPWRYESAVTALCREAGATASSRCRMNAAQRVDAPILYLGDANPSAMKPPS